ncbi:Dimethylaniline monooxygenase [N-oxide-forming] [Aphelenchoides besseyi]|nr:Dimethylaniline monooxygenase [N-oxide-forming] [Aphelenchoides besseyi]
MKRVAVVGAGPSGLASARHAVLNGHEVTIFEKRNVLGGRWNFSVDPKFSTVSLSFNTQNSGVLCQFSDFPISNGHSLILPQHDAATYLLDYAKEHELNNRTKFDTEVTAICRGSDFEKDGKWIPVDEEFDYVLVCTGWNQKPWRPNKFRLEDAFEGTISHASQFTSPESYYNKTVVLVGFGNSATEIARIIGPIAKKVYIAARHGEWTTEIVNSNGRPFDLSYQTQLGYLLRSLTPKPLRNLWLERRSLNERQSCGPVPEHRFLATLPTFIDGLKLLIASGRVVVESQLLSFSENGVEFTSGTRIEKVDEVIFCTGYQFDFSLIENGRLIGVHDNDFQLYLHMFPTELREHPTLACIGFVQPFFGSRWPISELQSRVFFQVQNGKVKLPSVFDMRENAEWRRCCVNVNYLITRRHTHIEDYVGFSNELADLIGARPTWQNLIIDPKLMWSFLTKPAISAQFRLCGPNAWPEARKTIISTSTSPSLTSSIKLVVVVVFLSIFLRYAFWF